jgi:hypothetical protein
MLSGFLNKLRRIAHSRELSQTGTLSPSDLENLAQYLKADYEPRQDFLPPELTPEDFKQRENALSKPI